MSCETDWENPHTFEEAVAFLKASETEAIDYEVKIDGHQGALITRDVWLEAVKNHSFIDYDGMANEVSADGKILNTDSHACGWLKPSQADKIRPETAYILWYNR
jgi:hypothetical protein